MEEMGTALALVARLFQPRTKKGGAYCHGEHIVNACQRNLSTYSDDDLRAIISGCNDLKQLAAQEIDARNADTKPMKPWRNRRKRRHYL